MSLKEKIEGRRIGELVTDNTTPLDKERWCVEDIEGNMLYLREQIITVYTETPIGDITIINCEGDEVLIFKGDKLEKIFSIYDKSYTSYEEDIGALIGVGHETLHIYIPSTGKYIVRYTR